MKPVILADNITSPLGFSSAQNFEALRRGETGVQLHTQTAFLPEPFYASLFSAQQKKLLQQQGTEDFTFFEQLLIHSIQSIVKNSGVDTSHPRLGLVISTTKGNISLLERNALNAALKRRIALHHSAQLVATYLGFSSKPLVVSHACISGLVALNTAMRMLQQGLYDEVLVAGADVITQFVLTGFQSFHALSNQPCQPFDADRKGINLGEGAAAVLLSAQNAASGPQIRLAGAAISNDANHISGPSRTGAELHQAIEAAIGEAGLQKQDIDFISAHGTATIYNDEMEAKAVNLSGLQQKPLNSLKGYYGHTLGAAGLIEVVAALHSIRNNVILPTLGYHKPGTTQNVQLSSILQPGKYSTCLKTASGFGGCNAAVILQQTH